MLLAARDTVSLYSLYEYPRLLMARVRLDCVPADIRHVFYGNTSGSLAAYAGRSSTDART